MTNSLDTTAAAATTTQPYAVQYEHRTLTGLVTNGSTKDKTKKTRDLRAEKRMEARRI